MWDASYYAKRHDEHKNIIWSHTNLFFGEVEMFTSQHDSLSFPQLSVSILYYMVCVSMGHAWEVITALRALVNVGWILTLSHGLEVQFATVASKPSHGAGPDLEHVDASWLESTDDHCVGLAPDGAGVIFWLVLAWKKTRC